MTMDISPIDSDLRQTLNAINQPAAANQSGNPNNALGQADFLRLLTTQLQQQDPLEPVDNKEMIAQMAQFSGLANTAATNDTLEQIVGRLDALIAMQAEPQSPALEQEQPDAT
jgi:flagellar basal-body rod modification protein FlgD